MDRWSRQIDTIDGQGWMVKMAIDGRDTGQDAVVVKKIRGHDDASVQDERTAYNRFVLSVFAVKMYFRKLKKKVYLPFSSSLFFFTDKVQALVIMERKKKQCL